VWNATLAATDVPEIIRATCGTVIARTAPLADRAAHAAAEALGQQWFGPNFKESTFDAWAARIAHLLFVAEDRETGAFLGYADQMFLAPAVDAALRAGTIAEEDFDDLAVLGDAELLALPAGTTITMYLAGMCVTAPGTVQGREAAKALRACRRSLLSEWRSRGLHIAIVMAAATEAGERIAHRGGGRLISPAAERVDGYNLYELPDLLQDAEGE
jgi:hypothetical protein